MTRDKPLLRWVLVYKTHFWVLSLKLFLILITATVNQKANIREDMICCPSRSQHWPPFRRLEINHYLSFSSWPFGKKSAGREVLATLPRYWFISSLRLEGLGWLRFGHWDTNPLYLKREIEKFLALCSREVRGTEETWQESSCNHKAFLFLACSSCPILKGMQWCNPATTSRFPNS